jgi:hypothetical protein
MRMLIHSSIAQGGAAVHRDAPYWKKEKKSLG